MRRAMNDTNEVMEIDLQKLFMRWLANWWIIVLCGLIFAFAGLVYTKQFVTPMYRASITVYVNNVRAGNQVESISSSSISTSKQLVKTYIKIISSNSVLSKVAEEASCDLETWEIRNMMSATQEDETELFKVHFLHPDPEMAAKLANAVAKVIPSELGEIVEGSSTKIIDYAKIPTSRYTPSYSKNTILSGMVGCFLAVAYITIRFLLDVRIKEAEDLTQVYEYPILGQIPNFAQLSSKRSHKSSYETTKDTEAKE